MTTTDTHPITFQIGDIVIQARPIYQHQVGQRGIVIATDDMLVVRLEAGKIHNTDFRHEWELVPPEQQTPGERIQRVEILWYDRPEALIPNDQDLSWYLTLQFVPAAIQQNFLESVIPSFAQLALWVAKWVDPYSRTVLPQVANALASWDPSEDDPPAHETLAWRVWMAFFSEAEQDMLLAGNWPGLTQLAQLAAIEAQRTRRRLQSLAHAKTRLVAIEN